MYLGDVKCDNAMPPSLHIPGIYLTLVLDAERDLVISGIILRPEC